MPNNIEKTHTRMFTCFQNSWRKPPLYNCMASVDPYTAHFTKFYFTAHEIFKYSCRISVGLRSQFFSLQVELCPNITTMVDHFNSLALLVPTEILAETTPQMRAKVISRFIKVGACESTSREQQCMQCLDCSLEKNYAYMIIYRLFDLRLQRHAISSRTITP